MSLSVCCLKKMILMNICARFVFCFTLCVLIRFQNVSSQLCFLKKKKNIIFLFSLKFSQKRKPEPDEENGLQGSDGLEETVEKADNREEKSKDEETREDTDEEKPTHRQRDAEEEIQEKKEKDKEKIEETAAHEENDERDKDGERDPENRTGTMGNGTEEEGAEDVTTKNRVRLNLSDLFDNVLQQNPLPHFCVYVTWVMLVLTMAICAFSLILFSMQWGSTTSEEWLASFFASFAESFFLFEPLKVGMGVLRLLRRKCLPVEPLKVGVGVLRLLHGEFLPV